MQVPAKLTLANAQTATLYEPTPVTACLYYLTHYQLSKRSCVVLELIIGLSLFKYRNTIYVVIQLTSLAHNHFSSSFLKYNV